MPVEITETLDVTTRAAWRRWLAEHGTTAREIWLIRYRLASGQADLTYLQSVEEALCFGWIDGITKKLDAERTAQRFSPRRPKSHWTELNKERARRLIAAGLMTEAGYAVLPDLSTDNFLIAEDILAALRADPATWENFQRFPAYYQRIRISNLEEVRPQPELFQSRLANMLRKTRQNKMYGVLE
jgi:uncharacterized protein YdeI (YjbR/CyaY-like superfamily)